MVGERELTKRLIACIETEAHIPPFQMGVAQSIVRRIVPMVMTIIKEEVRIAVREHSLETYEDH